MLSVLSSGSLPTWPHGNILVTDQQQSANCPTSTKEPELGPPPWLAGANLLLKPPAEALDDSSSSSTEGTSVNHSNGCQQVLPQTNHIYSAPTRASSTAVPQQPLRPTTSMSQPNETAGLPCQQHSSAVLSVQPKDNKRLHQVHQPPIITLIVPHFHPIPPHSVGSVPSDAEATWALTPKPAGRLPQAPLQRPASRTAAASGQAVSHTSSYKLNNNAVTTASTTRSYTLQSWREGPTV